MGPISSSVSIISRIVSHPVGLSHPTRRMQCKNWPGFLLLLLQTVTQTKCGTHNKLPAIQCDFPHESPEKETIEFLIILLSLSQIY